MHIYGIGAGRDVPLQSLCGWLSALHESRFDRQTQRALENRGMRVLNHEHIFDLPLQSDNGLDLDGLTAGLSASARALKEHAQYAQAVKDLGQRYLGEGTSLLHGDFYPGSWVESGNDVWIIDPEFCFLGPAEFDVGVFVDVREAAHAPPRSRPALANDPAHREPARRSLSRPTRA